MMRLISMFEFILYSQYLLIEKFGKCISTTSKMSIDGVIDSDIFFFKMPSYLTEIGIRDNQI